MSDNVMTQLSELIEKFAILALPSTACLTSIPLATPCPKAKSIGSCSAPKAASFLKRKRSEHLIFIASIRAARHVVELSAFYFRYSEGPALRCALAGPRELTTAIYRIATALVRLTAPILAFTAEEIWRYLPRTASEPDAACTSRYKPMGAARFPKTDARRSLEHLREVRTETLKRSNRHVRSASQALWKLVSCSNRKARSLNCWNSTRPGCHGAVHRFSGGACTNCRRCHSRRRHALGNAPWPHHRGCSR